MTRALIGNLPADELKKDKKEALRFGLCALGKKALYLGVFIFPRIHYIPFKNVDRVYKRLAVTKGFYESKRIFAAVPYLVVAFDGREKAYRFEREEDVNALLEQIKTSTSIPVGKK